MTEYDKFGTILIRSSLQYDLLLCKQFSFVILYYILKYSPTMVGRNKCIQKKKQNTDNCIDSVSMTSHFSATHFSKKTKKGSTKHEIHTILAFILKWMCDVMIHPIHSSTEITILGSPFDFLTIFLKNSKWSKFYYQKPQVFSYYST